MIASLGGAYKSLSVMTGIRDLQIDMLGKRKPQTFA